MNPVLELSVENTLRRMFVHELLGEARYAELVAYIVCLLEMAGGLHNDHNSP